jgi:hypothetical protein
MLLMLLMLRLLRPLAKSHAISEVPGRWMVAVVLGHRLRHRL